ncbi:MAG: glycosyltransferase [Bacteroidales bacterium]|nr:glycosyltransferase [Bacteroidales bacterium]
MRILVLSFSLTSGGAERFVVDLCNALSAAHEVTLLTSNDDAAGSNACYREELLPAVSYRNLHAASGHAPKALRGILRTVRELRPDIVHAHSDLVQLLLPALLVSGVKYVHTLHNVAGFFLPHTWLRPLFRAFYRRRVIPVTISRVCSESYHAVFGLDNDHLIPNGRAALRTSPQRETLRAELAAFKAGRPLFLHLARYSPQKNQAMLFEAFAAVPDARLLVLGRDYPAELVQRLSGERIRFAGERTNVADYLSCADYFVLSSLFEGLPISLLEAMAFGLVSVSTPAGGVVDVIRDGENGFLAADFSAASLAAAMRRALSCPLDRQAIMQEYQEKYAMETCAARYEQLFAET